MQSLRQVEDLLDSATPFNPRKSENGHSIFKTAAKPARQGDHLQGFIPSHEIFNRRNDYQDDSRNANSQAYQSVLRSYSGTQRDKDDGRGNLAKSDDRKRTLKGVGQTGGH
jgi:hypothetical protein